MLPSNNSRMINELGKQTYSTLQYISSFNFFMKRKIIILLFQSTLKHKIYIVKFIIILFWKKVKIEWCFIIKILKLIWEFN